MREFHASTTKLFALDTLPTLVLTIRSWRFGSWYFPKPGLLYIFKNLSIPQQKRISGGKAVAGFTLQVAGY
jgi:hypothetical protein